MSWVHIVYNTGCLDHKQTRAQAIKVMTGERKGLSLQQSFSEIQPSTVLLNLIYFKTSIDHTATTGIKFHY